MSKILSQVCASRDGGKNAPTLSVERQQTISHGEPQPGL
jgi:hypothetical protein